MKNAILGLAMGVGLSMGVAGAATAPSHCDGINVQRVQLLATQTRWAASIHQQYLDNPSLMSDATGNADWQRQWVTIHGETADALTMLLRGCNP